MEVNMMITFRHMGNAEDRQLVPPPPPTEPNGASLMSYLFRTTNPELSYLRDEISLLEVARKF